MPFLLAIVGLLLIVTAIRNTIDDLATNLQDDLTATVGGVTFFAWVAAIVMIGAIGYIPRLQGISRGLMALVILVMLLKEGGGIFEKFRAQLTSIPASPQPSVASAGPLPITIQVQGATGAGAAGGSSAQLGKAVGDLSGIPGAGAVGTIVGSVFG